MPSRMIHYLIGTEVIKHVAVKDKKRFLFGNMLPDCIDGPGGRGGKKGISHFSTGLPAENHAKEENRKLFYQKYKQYIQDELYQGYLCHLAVDVLWYYDINRAQCRAMNDAQLEIHLQKMYRDYHRLNEILRKDYSLSFPKLEWMENSIEEVEPDFWNYYMTEFQQDFLEYQNAGKNDLELLTYDVVTDYIGDAVKLAGREIMNIRNESV